MKEPKIGWVDYFVNYFTSQTLINEVVDCIEDDEIIDFNTEWFDYSYNKKLK